MNEDDMKEFSADMEKLSKVFSGFGKIGNLDLGMVTVRIERAKEKFDQKEKAKMTKQAQIDLLKMFSRSMLTENNPFHIGDIIQQKKIGDSYNYDFPTDGDVAVVMEIFPDEFTQVERSAGSPWTKENMLIACITEHDVVVPDIRVYNVDWRYFEHVQ